uniref:N-acetyltransferase domain-containing protein n=1 Tax=Globodera pallida TaxID=36090 RepID=A0A183BTQ0_GLOPA
MRINANDSIVGDCAVLVPYCLKHVQKYHGWMGSEELRRETCSEALTLEEEEQMQRAWRDDPDKLTFIILDRRTMERSGGDEIASMVGDINAFLCSGQIMDFVGEEWNITEGDGRLDGRRCFELSVMLAEPGFRRRGIALEACKLMIAYILQRIGESIFIAKIGAGNQPSLALFRNRLSFSDCAFSEVFESITLRLDFQQAKELLKNVQLRIESYTQS